MNYTDIIEFFHSNRPTLYELLNPGIIFFVLVSLVITLAGLLKLHRHWATGYTRKLFHFTIFFTAAGIQYYFGLRMLCLFGSLTSLVIFYALLKADSHPWYEALARNKDAPHRSYYIIVPYVATLMGGLLNNFFIPEAALAGYLVTGLGDAIGEPVGTRWGKHRYRVPNFRNINSYRSIEGSLAVFTVSLLMLILLMRVTSAPPTNVLYLKLGGIAFACMLAEAISPHGWDNLTLQLMPAWLWHSFVL